MGSITKIGVTEQRGILRVTKFSIFTVRTGRTNACAQMGKCVSRNGQATVPKWARQYQRIPKGIHKKIISCIRFEDTSAEVEKMLTLFANVEVADDDRAANMAIMSLLEEHGYLCQNDVPVPSRGDGKDYAGRIGIVATKMGGPLR